MTSFQVLIDHIDKETGDVTTLDNIYHGLQDGDHVTFTEVKGMTAINNTAPIKVTYKSKEPFVVFFVSVLVLFNVFERGYKH